MCEFGYIHDMAQLKRRLGFWLLTAYGVGTTLGAGIYVLVGEVAAEAGYYTPLSFLLAGLLALPSGLAFAELSARYPKSAGEAVYLQAAFSKPLLAAGVGLLVAASGIISAATLLNGFTGYLSAFIQIPDWIAILGAIACLSFLCILGIKESVGFAAIITVIEIAALLLVSFLGADLIDTKDVPKIISSTPLQFIGLLTGGLIAFYAFIGFEDMVNVAEEVIDIKRNMPRAIIATLLITCSLYLIVGFVAVFSVGPDTLAAQSAPLAFIFSQASGWSDAPISFIAIFAIINGAVIQMVMASRVLYGMANQGWLPSYFGQILPKQATPMNATLVVSVLILGLALFVPLRQLAQATSTTILLIFIAINIALWRIKQLQPDYSGFQIPVWVLFCGAFGAFLLVITNFF